MSKRDLGQRYHKALEILEERERKLTRAFNAWSKARGVVRSLQKRIDSETAEEIQQKTAKGFNGTCVTCERQFIALDFNGQCDKCAPYDEPPLGESTQAKAFLAEAIALGIVPGGES